MLMRTVNHHPIMSLSREMDRLLESMFSARRPASVQPGAVFPPLNVWEDAQSLYVEAELPGLGMENLEIMASPGELTLKGEREHVEPEGVAVVRRERVRGCFERQLELPCEIDVEGVTATLRDGVLTVTLPKAASRRARRIEVTDGSPGNG